MNNGKCAFVLPDFTAFGFKGTTLAERVWESLKEKTPDFDLVRTKTTPFRDSSFKVELLDSVRNKQIYIIVSPYTSASEQVMLTSQLMDACRRASADRSSINLMETYNPWYAQDKRDVGQREAVTANRIAEYYINSGLTHLFYFEPHSQIALDCSYDSFDPIYMAAFHAKNLAEEFEISNSVVSQPDEGGKRSKFLAEALGRPLVKIGKSHDDKETTENIRALPVTQDLSGLTVFNYDDLIRSGKTAVGTSESAKKAGAKRVIFVATHPGIYNPELLFGSDAIDAVRVTNTIPIHPTHTKLREYDISDFAAAIIYRKSHGMDVSGYIMGLAPAAKKSL